MKLERLSYDPGAVVDFYEEGLGALGALCERTWHDRIEVIAEGRAAQLWDAGENLHEGEIHFVPADATGTRNAAAEVFPGCPLTFRLAEALRDSPLTLHRLVLAREANARAPDVTTAERLWRSQFPNTERWSLSGPFKPGFHFSLLVLVRCDIQAIEQHWTLHRMAISVSDGRMDDHLARDVVFAQPAEDLPGEFHWPPLTPAVMSAQLQAALEKELTGELDLIRSRQEKSLRREMDRIDAYFENYESELNARSHHHLREAARVRTGDRLRAARSEHERRRIDQVARHEIRVYPHYDALLMIAEPAWKAQLEIKRQHRAQRVEALFVPRSRRWEIRESEAADERG